MQGGDEPKTRIALPPNLAGGDSILLETDRRNEMSDVWKAFGDNYKIIAYKGSQAKAKLGVPRTASLIRLSIESGIL